MKTIKGSQAAVQASRRMAGGSGCALSRAEPAAVLPIYASLLSRERLNVLLCQSGQRLYWRTLTPLIMLWGMLYQRLHHDHTCDAAVSYLRSGAVDDLDGQDPHGQPLSQRLRSESTAAYVQGRNRLPLTLVQAASQWVAHQVLSWSQDSPQGTAQPYWHGRAVRVLDGTTFRLRPHGDLAQTYGQAHNGQGCSYWVVAKSLVSFCLYRQVCIGYAEGSQQSSEPGLFRQVVQQDPVAQSIYIADQGLGVYRVAQVACHYGHDVVLRLEQRVAQRLLRLAGGPPLHDHQERPLVWQPAPTAVVEPDWPIQPIVGRVLYIRVEPAGFRPFDVYLFTTLTDARRYSLAEIAALYGLRWRGELDLRHIKTVMQMEEFTVQSAALFRKELAVGLLAYNLVCALMTQAALQAGVCPAQLSFSCCLRRIAMFLCYGMPAWVNAQSNPLTYLLSELAGCRLPVQPQKTHHEPRRVRRRQSTYPPLLGNRDAARRQWLEEMA